MTAAKHTPGKLDFCRHFIRRTKPYGRTILCQREPDVRVVAYGPNGEIVPHVWACSRHAEAQSRGYRHSEANGWRIVLEPTAKAKGGA